MQNINTQLMEYSKKNPDEKAIVSGLMEYCTSLMSVSCDFCNGDGHTAKKCSTKKTFDLACKLNP